MLPLRNCVVAVIQNSMGDVLAGQRSDTPGAWQLPQGGIELNETAEKALMRELKEEIGYNEYSVLKKANTLVKYTFQQGSTFKIAQEFSGQQQQWFLLQLKDESGPNLSLATDKEFSSLKWMSAEILINGIIDWKKKSYQEGFELLGLQFPRL